jgi:hypothetical protein
VEPTTVSPQFNPVAAYADQQQAAVTARRADDEARQTRETREVVARVSDRVSLSETSRREAAPESTPAQDPQRVETVRADQARAAAVERREDEQPEQTPRSVTRALEAYSQTNALS